MIPYEEAKKLTDEFLEKKVLEINNINHKIMDKAHAKEFRWNAKGESLLHFEHIAYVILRPYIIEAVRNNIEGSAKAIGNCITENVLFFIEKQASIDMRKYLWHRFLRKGKGNTVEMAPYSPANWFIVAMRLWFIEHPEEQDRMHISEKDWSNTTLLRKYIIENLHRSEYPFNNFFNDSSYDELIRVFYISFTPIETEEEKINKVIKAIRDIDEYEEILYKNYDQRKAIWKKLETQGKDINEIRKCTKDSYTQNTNIFKELDKIKLSTEKIEISNNKLDLVLMNQGRAWCEAGEESDAKHTKQIQTVMELLKKYSAENPLEIKKNIKERKLVFTCKSKDKIATKIIDRIFMQNPEIFPKVIQDCLFYEEDNGSINLIPLSTIKNRKPIK